MKNKALVIGCGLIGKRRASSLPKHIELAGFFDIDQKKSFQLSIFFKTKQYLSLEEALNDETISSVIIATSHDSLSELTIKCIQCNKHVFVEKPGGRNFNEILKIKQHFKTSNLKLAFGFNHRFHRALRKAKNLIKKNVIGDLMYIRGRYGHGGRLGYAKEWRANPKVSGGGELIDQGPHLIDLSRMFLGDFDINYSTLKTYYWDMPVEDNAFMILNTKTKKTAFLHVSCTEWKNIFCFEIFGRLGKLEINGLGRSYGTEKLTFYKMLPEMGPPDVTSWEFLTDDDSWVYETNEFFKLIEGKPSDIATLDDALKNMKIIKNLYEQNNYDHS